jgi:hypothetical protein
MLGDPQPEVRRIGRPAEREIPRTHLHDWMGSQKISSQAFHQKCADIAVSRKISVEFVPTKSSVDDMKVARFYPSLVVAYLIEIATGGDIGLKQWADDIKRHGTRHGKRHTSRASTRAGSTA